jgi:thiamine-phosphate diphosphorylase
MSPVRGLYVITADYPELGRTHVDVAAAALRGGARVVQYRDKVRRGTELLAVAREVQTLCREFGAAFVVNDHADVAMQLRADGLHLGQGELQRCAIWRPSWEAFFGITAWSGELAEEARRLGADYVGAGPVNATSSKEVDRDPIGLEGVRAVCDVGLPVAAIGGIRADDVRSVIAAGAAAVCVMAAVGTADEPVRAARELARLADTMGENTWPSSRT